MLVPKCETVPFPVLRAATLIVKLNISTLSKCYNSVVLFRPLRVALYSAAVIPSVGRYSSTVRNFSNLWELPMICSVHFYSMYLTVHIVVQSVVIILIQEFVFSFFFFVNNGNGKLQYELSGCIKYICYLSPKHFHGLVYTHGLKSGL